MSISQGIINISYNITVTVVYGLKIYQSINFKKKSSVKYEQYTQFISKMKCDFRRAF